jgi:hypothetical protein
LETDGLAPSGTTSGRVFCAILGADEDFSGSVYFDSLTQSEAGASQTTAGEIGNPGLEDGLTGNAYELGEDLPNWTWYGGTNAGFITGDQGQEGDQSLVIVYPNNLLGQDFQAVTGLEYAVNGYIRTPSSDPMTSTTAYATFLLEFFNPAGDTVSVSVVETAHLTNGSPQDTWIAFGVTNRAPWSGPVTGRISCALLDLEGTPYGGSVYFDGMSVYAQTSPIANAQSGALWNPGFEYTANGTKLPYIDNWENLGFDGQVDDAYSRSGEHALKLTYPETLSAQYWDAEAGSRYASTGYVFTASGDEVFAGSTNVKAMVLLQYLNETGGVIQTYESDFAWATNMTADTWIELTAEGQAPSGTVTGRTVCALLGLDEAFGGAVWFDDMGQSLIAAASTTQAGVVYNPGFEDGTLGNAYDLGADMPNWEWAGGTNAGFVVDGTTRSGYQSLQIVFPNNLAYQEFEAETGMSYIVEGYIYTPSSGGLTDSTATASLLLEFFNPAGDTVSVSSVSSLELTSSSAKDTWHKFSVTNRAPWVGPTTGRVSCAFLDLDGGPTAASVFFDDIAVYETNIAVAANTQSGALWNPGFEYTANGTKLPYIDNWEGLGFDGKVDNAHARTGEHALQITYPETLLAQYWSADPGTRYATEGYAFTPAETLGANLVLNPALSGAGSVPTSWQGFDDGNHDADSGTYRSAPNAWAFWWASGIYQDISSGFSVGDELQFGAYLLTPSWDQLRNGTKYGVVVLEFYDSGSTLIDSTSASPTINSSSAADTWILSEGTATVPSGAVTARVVVRCNTPAGGDGRFLADDVYVRKVNDEPNQLVTSTNAQALIILQYLDSTGTNILATYTSDPFTGDATPGTWSNLSAMGVAPSGTVTARTLCALVGLDEAFAGAVWFDDMTQTVVSTGGSTAGLLSNPGFEDGTPGNTYYLGEDLPSWEWAGGTNAGFIVDSGARSGYHALQIVFPNNLAYQEFEAETGMSYIVEGYIYTPSSGGLTDSTATASLLLEFFNPAGDTVSVSSVSSLELTSSSAKDTWHKFSVTNRAPWVGPTTGRVSCAFLDLDGGPTAASVFFDDIAVYETNIAVAANTQSGALWNPGFEYTANGTKLPYIDNWENLGFDGVVDNEHSRSGENALKITYPETLSAQYWPATGGYRYGSEAHVFTPSGDDNFTSSTNAHAVLLLQYLDATGTNILATYESAYYDGSADADAWSNLSVEGVAPMAAVTGRTVVAVLGYDEAFGGAVWFDDINQSLVSTSSSQSGLLLNPGFEDGITGNAYYLSNDLPHWAWLGGDNAGFIGSDHAREGTQAAIVTYPDNMYAQDFTASSGQTYVAEGYLFTPSEADFSSDGSSWGRLTMLFYVDGSEDPVAEAITYSPKFTASHAADTWHYFAVTGTAPSEAVVTGRLVCAMESLDAAGDFMLGGVIYFDDLTLTEQGGVSAWEQWQLDQFGGTNVVDGGRWDDFDGDTYANWSEFIAGTMPTNDGSYLAATVAPQGSDSYVITWPGVAGRYYGVGYATNLSGAGFEMLSSNISAVVPTTSYTASPPAEVERYYYRITVRTNLFE